MKDGTREHYEERILRVQVYIQKHLDDALTLDELARVACFSPYHFHRLFSGMVGETVSGHIRRLRLERAAIELRYTQASVIEIALDAGYETHESFTRAFRAIFGKPPSEYRNEHANKPTAADADLGERYVAVINQPEGKAMQAEIKSFEPMTAAFVRHVGPYTECQSAWRRLFSDGAVMRTMGPNTIAFGIYHDDPHVTEADKTRYDACVTVPDGFAASGGIGTQRIEGGDYAVLVHKGSYSGLRDAYRWLYGEWLPSSGRETKSAPALEVYRNDPNITPEDELLTEIRVPLK